MATRSRDLLLAVACVAACAAVRSTEAVRVARPTATGKADSHTAPRNDCQPATEFGVKGDGVTPADVPLAKALAACATIGGGRVPLADAGAGVFFFGRPVELVSNVVLVVDAGMRMQFGNRSDAWPTLPGLPGGGPSVEGGTRAHPLVHGAGVTDSGVGGAGRIDGAGKDWWTGGGVGGRPMLLACEQCARFRLDDVTVSNSPSWTIHIWDSDDVAVTGVKVRNPPKAPNTDGFDIDSSRNVILRNLDVSTSDDHICIKSGKDAAGRAFGKPSRNITIEDSKFGLGAGVAVGTEMSGGVYDVVVRRCTFGLGAHSAVRVKSARGRGGLMDNITFEDIAVDGVDVALSVQMSYKPGPLPANSSDPGIARLGRLTVRRLHGEALIAGELLCLPEAPCGNITLDDVRVWNPLAPWKCSNAAGTATGVFPEPKCLGVGA